MDYKYIFESIHNSLQKYTYDIHVPYRLYMPKCVVSTVTGKFPPYICNFCKKRKLFHSSSMLCEKSPYMVKYREQIWFRYHRDSTYMALAHLSSTSATVTPATSTPTPTDTSSEYTPGHVQCLCEHMRQLCTVAYALRTYAKFDLKLYTLKWTKYLVCSTYF